MYNVLRYFLLFSFLLLSVLTIFSCDKRNTYPENMYSSYNSDKPGDGYSWREREINYDQNLSALTKDKLVSTLWALNFPETGFLLVFYIDDVFRIGTRPTGVEFEGTYRIIDEYSVQLSPESNDIEAFTVFAQAPNSILFFMQDSADLFLQDKLRSKKEPSSAWSAYGSEPKTGSVLFSHGINVRILEGRYVTTENATFRTGPGLKYSPIVIPSWEDEGGGTFLPREETLYVLGASVEKYNVGNWNSHWYLVSYPQPHSILTGWVYGEFLAPFDESKE